MVVVTRTASAQPSARQATRHPRPSRPPAPHRSVPDDNAFEESIARFNDPTASEEERCQKALAPLPPPVDAKNCTRMWIPAARLTAERNIDELCVSLKADYQPELWRKYLHLGCVRDFVRVPHQGIGFVCTSEEALRCLGGVTLKVCDTLVTIRKYSLFDKLYFVDLQRLPFNVPDRDIYNWFVDRDARPVLITATHDHGMLKSRARTVYFNAVSCPPGLFEADGEPLREIFFDPSDKPCFVQHRFHKHNRVRPPSLRPSARKPSDVSDASMMGGETVHAPAAVPTHADSPPNSATLDRSPVLVKPGVALGSVLASVEPSSSDKPCSNTPVGVPSTTAHRGPSAPRSAKSRTHTVIPGTVSADAPEWKVVQHSQYGVLNRNGAKFIEPGTPVPCDLAIDNHDSSALSYTSPIHPNYYEVLVADGYDTSLPPDVDLCIGESEECEEIHGFTADTPLIPMSSIQALKHARRMPLKVEQVTPAELDKIIAEFIATDVLHYTSHEDVLATIQAQPAYFRQLFKISLQQQQRLVTDHAIYRTICALPALTGQPDDFLSRLRFRFGETLPSSDVILEAIIPDEEARYAACHCALSDLFLMIFAPSIYVDPLKVQALLPQQLAPKRIRHAPFLLWSDLILMCIAHTDVAEHLRDHITTPPHVFTALTYLSDLELSTTVETALSYLIRPQL